MGSLKAVTQLQAGCPNYFENFRLDVADRTEKPEFIQGFVDAISQHTAECTACPMLAEAAVIHERMVPITK